MKVQCEKLMKSEDRGPTVGGGGGTHGEHVPHGNSWVLDWALSLSLSRCLPLVPPPRVSPPL